MSPAVDRDYRVLLPPALDLRGSGATSFQCRGHPGFFSEHMVRFHELLDLNHGRHGRHNAYALS